MTVKLVSDDNFSQCLDDENNLVIVLITASWCTRCDSIHQPFDKLSTVYPNSKFYKADVDLCPKMARSYGLFSLPTFIFFRDSEEIERFSGCNESKLENRIIVLQTVKDNEQSKINEQTEAFKKRKISDVSSAGSSPNVKNANSTGSLFNLSNDDKESSSITVLSSKRSSYSSFTLKEAQKELGFEISWLKRKSDLVENLKTTIREKLLNYYDEDFNLKIGLFDTNSLELLNDLVLARSKEKISNYEFPDKDQHYYNEILIQDFVSIFIDCCLTCYRNKIDSNDSVIVRREAKLDYPLYKLKAEKKIYTAEKPDGNSDLKSDNLTHGRVEFVVKELVELKNKYIEINKLVIEVKRRISPSGIAQMLLELGDAFRTNIDNKYGGVVFGAITDLETWQFASYDGIKPYQLFDPILSVFTKPIEVNKPFKDLVQILYLINAYPHPIIDK